MRRLVLGLLPLVPLLSVLPLACAAAPVSRIGLVMRAPQGLLDEATSVTLSVFPADQASCDAGSGHVSRIPEGDDTQQFSLDRAGCPAGVAWCKDIELEQGDDPQMFAVVAQGAGRILAEGCVAAAVDQDPLEVTIKVQRYNPPPCCGDGALQSGEQCDSGPAPMASAECPGTTADEVCAADCLANEILLSINNTAPPEITAGPPGSKAQLSMGFLPGVDKTANTLRAVFQNSDPATSKTTDINIRFLSEDLTTIASSVPLSQQLRLPLDCGDLDGDGDTGVQRTPSIAQIGADLTGVVYASDQEMGGTFETWLVVHTLDGCRQSCDPADTACLALYSPIQVSLPGVTPGVEDPDLAGGPSDAALAVWSRNGRVFGRIWRTSGDLVPAAAEIEIAPAGSRPRVAGTASGWTVVYQGSGNGDGDGVFLRTIDLDGAVGGELRVNARPEGLQDQPDLAQLPDGRSIVVWRSAGDIFFQRYDAAGAPLPGDQDAPLNTTTAGEQLTPAVTAAGALGDFYAVAWEHQDGGKVYARFPGADGGFRFNSVTGQNDDFEASHPRVAGLRHLPAVAIGGRGYVAVGWQDERQDAPGVYVRRFPLPSL